MQLVEPDDVEILPQSCNLKVDAIARKLSVHNDPASDCTIAVDSEGEDPDWAERTREVIAVDEALAPISDEELLDGG